MLGMEGHFPDDHPHRSSGNLRVFRCLSHNMSQMSRYEIIQKFYQSETRWIDPPSPADRDYCTPLSMK